MVKNPKPNHMAQKETKLLEKEAQLCRTKLSLI